MQIIQCPIKSCGRGELWDSERDIEAHLREYHSWVTGWELVDGELIVLPGVVKNPSLTEDHTPAWSAFYRDGSFEATFAEIFQEGFEILVERQRKYGPQNISNQGLYGIFTRMRDDKMSRIGMAMNGKVVNGRVEIDDIDQGEEADTIEDGYFDTGNYSFISLALLRGVWGLPLEDEMEDLPNG